jgi:hypothetical protein
MLTLSLLSSDFIASDIHNIEHNLGDNVKAMNLILT